MNFDKLNLNPKVIEAVTEKGYTKPTPIQEKAIPAILEGKDLLGGAQTGTGKTAAFALPILTNLANETKKLRHPRALILTPTRELAAQVGESFKDYGKNLKLNTVMIFGGVKINPQKSALKNGADIVVATPGRLLDHLNQKSINLNSIEIFALDEADKMLDMGFINDIKKIISKLPHKKQNLLFSATYDEEIRALASSLLKNPTTVEVTKRNSAAQNVKQIQYKVVKGDKFESLKHLLTTEGWYQVILFARTKHGVNKLTKGLQKSNITAAAIHGDKSQGARTRALKDFKKGDIQVLVATDVASRGIDLADLDCVINYDLPQVAEDYIHRIGRTGRAGKSGLAVSLISPEEGKQLKKIEKLIKKDIEVAQFKGFNPKTEKKEKNKSKKVPDPFKINPNQKNIGRTKGYKKKK